MKIEILGSGCPRCKALKKTTEAALKELGLYEPVEEIRSIQEIMNRGVMMTPALYINGVPKVIGRVASLDEMKLLIQESAQEEAEEEEEEYD